ncbi:hypothetical protein [Tabrizicola soli]|uniref:DUF1844 domain-containing protein n=1 Tax=Tabrizicola soli TaxID=2185115 RepID=A0ABV7E0W9_9RHOB|nr:hypothetical protein [Tabrizicola soli]
MPLPLSEGKPSAGPFHAKVTAISLYGVIRAAATAHLQIDSDTAPEGSDLIRNAVDGMLEAAEKLAKQLSEALDAAEDAR